MELFTPFTGEGWQGPSVDILKGEMFKLIDMLPGTGSDQMQRKVLMSSFVSERSYYPVCMGF